MNSWADELVTFHGESMLSLVVVWDQRLRLAKPNATWPELLAYQLGRAWLNVAEVVRPTGHPIKLDGVASDWRADSLLIRVAQTYSYQELPVHDLDEAIARELALSLWIRRRDAGPWNRVYLDGIPIFFDHHIAFGTEVDHQSIDGFLAPGGDAGYASQWRVRELGGQEVPDTKGERALSQDLAIHRVRNVSDFERHFDQTVDRIRGLVDSELQAAGELAGAPPNVPSFLGDTRDSLNEAAERLKPVLFEGL